jgi:hypothetical protein
MDERIRAAERARVAGDNYRDRSGGSRRESLARTVARWRPSAAVEPRPCIED